LYPPKMFHYTDRYLWNLLGTMSSTDFSILASSPLSRLSFPHIHQIDLYNFDWSFFLIMIGSTKFGMSTSISSLIVTFCDFMLFSSPTPLLLFLILLCLLSATLHSLGHLIISTFPVSQLTSGLCLCSQVYPMIELDFPKSHTLNTVCSLCPWYESYFLCNTSSSVNASIDIVDFNRVFQFTGGNFLLVQPSAVDK